MSNMHMICADITPFGTCHTRTPACTVARNGAFDAHRRVSLRCITSFGIMRVLPASFSSEDKTEGTNVNLPIK